MSKSAHQVVTISSSEADAVIPELGITARLLCEAVTAGEHARDRCTAHHPPAAPGFYAWSEIVCALRDLLKSYDWKADDAGNYSTVISPDGRIAIAVAGGDLGTGNSDMSPRTNHPKGRATEEAIRTNQLDLFTKIAPEPKADGPVTWILLFRRSTDGSKDVAHCEISRPDSMSEDGNIVSWQSRYLLPSIDFGFPPASRRKDDDDQGQDYDVPVAAR